MPPSQMCLGVEGTPISRKTPIVWWHRWHRRHRNKQERVKLHVASCTVHSRLSSKLSWMLMPLGVHLATLRVW
jgi:hypothetical protein